MQYKMKSISKKTVAFPVLLVFVFFSCSEGPQTTEPTQSAPTNLTILTEMNTYTWDESGYLLIKAKLTNTSTDTFYASLGDRINSSIDQEQLFVAEGSDGYIEKLEPDDSWLQKERGILYEGVRAVAIRPTKEYLVQAFVLWPNRDTGKFRIRIDYYHQIDSTKNKPQLVAYSNTFIIQ